MDQKEELTLEEISLRKRNGTRQQIFMSVLANASVLGPAMGFGYSAVALPTLTSPTSDLPIDSGQASWIASSAAISTPLGCVLSSFVMRRGRKVSLLVVSVVSLIGWLVIYFATNYEQVIVGRLISGLASGLASVPATVYTAEVATPKMRGTIVTWTSIAIALGILIVYIFGYFIQDNWRLIALMCAVFPVVAIIITSTILPESPIWLRDRGRMDEAYDILKRFRGIPATSEIPEDLKAEIQLRPQRKKQNYMKHLLKRSSVVPFTIMLIYFIFQQFSGLFVIVYYAVNITKDAGVKIDAYLGAILIGFTRLLASVLVASISKRFGRRLPSIISGSGMTFFMGTLSIYLYLLSRGYSIPDGGVIPVICISMYIFTSTLGFLVVPFAMIGEIFPARVKDTLTGATTCLAYIVSFITVKTYPDMLVIFGKHGVFMFYALVSLLGTIFVLMFLPETKGKTLREIEEIYCKKKQDSEDPLSNEKMIPMKDVTVLS